MHNRPIAKLIKWFVKREKGKISWYTYPKYKRRFAYLDRNDQKKILLLFLSSGKLKKNQNN